MISITEKESKILSGAVGFFNNIWVSDSLAQPIQNKLGLLPKEIEDTRAKLILLRKYLERYSPRDITSDFYPLLKKAIIFVRRHRAFDIEKRCGFTYNNEIRTKLEEQLQSFDNVMSQQWFMDTKCPKNPKLIDFLSIKYAEEILNQKKKLSLSERIFDEKFHILNSPSLFLPDLNYYRSCCELRGIPLCVAYMDIDDFKKFNTEFGEPRVDRDVLPRFMSALEAHLYSHGSAYRYGGDEYVIILPNISCAQAIENLRGFQATLKSLEFYDIKKHIEVSIGMIEVSEDSPYTDREIEKLAAQAKNYAKKNKKNCIATYKTSGFAEKDLFIPPDVS